MTEEKLTRSAKQAFEQIFKCPGAGRLDLLEVIGGTAPTITRLVNSMEKQGLIAESTDREGKRGQPVKRLYIQKGTRYSAGLNFTHNAIEVALINFDGSWIDSSSEPIDKPSAEEIEAHALNVLKGLLKKHKIRKTDLVGIGISVPGDFMADQKSINMHPYFKLLADLDVEKHFKSFFKLPIFIENDANCATLCELLVGEGRTHENFINLYLGYGVSSGLVFNNRPYRGKHGNSGNIGGQFPLMVNIRPSGQNLLEYLSGYGVDINCFEESGQLYKDDNELVFEWLTKASVQLQDKLYLIERLLDLDCIIIGGRLPMELLEEITRKVDTHTFYPIEDPLPPTEIACTKMGADVGVYGAALIPIYRKYFL